MSNDMWEKILAVDKPPGDLSSELVESAGGALPPRDSSASFDDPIESFDDFCEWLRVGDDAHFVTRLSFLLAEHPTCYPNSGTYLGRAQHLAHLTGARCLASSWS